MATDREEAGTEEVGADEVSTADVGAALEALHERLTTGGDGQAPSLAGLDAEELLRVMRLQERLVQLEHARVADGENSADVIGLLSAVPRDSTQANLSRSAETPQPAADERIDERGDTSAEAIATFGHAATRGAGGAANRGLIGRFEVLRVLGRGGQGLMLLANDPVLGRKVALKVPWSETLITPQLRRRFLREAQAVARLTHPHIVPVYEVGELGPICFIASAFVEGPNLAEWLKSSPAQLDAREAAAIVADLADAIQYAHSQGVLHRDLKPGNVILESRAVPGLGNTDAAGAPWMAKLTDFGLAKILDLTGDETRSGALIGTPAYMSPEQAKADHAQVGPASDVYSLGAILYELLTGRAPFRAESEAETLQRVIMEPAASMRRSRADVPADLDAICLKCLEKDPARRYASAADFDADLRRYLAGEPTVARPLSPAARATRWAGRNLRVAALLGLVAVLLVGMTTISTVAALRINAARRDAERNVIELTKRDALAREQSDVIQFNRAYQDYVGEGFNSARRVIDQLEQNGSQLEEFEWRLLKVGLRGNVGTVNGLSGGEYILSLKYSPDGRFLVAGTDKGNLLTWNATTFEQLERKKVHDVCVNSIELSPHGDIAATTSCDKLIKLWDTTSWECVGQLAGHSREVGACAFSPDGKRLVSGTRQQDRERLPPGEFRLWDLSTRACEAEWNCEPNAATSVAFINDGAAVVAGFRDGEVLQWDVTARPPQPAELSFPLPVSPRARATDWMLLCNALFASADRRYLAYFGNSGVSWTPTWNKLMLVDLWSGETRTLFDGEYMRGPGAFSADSRLLAIGEDLARVYSTSTGSVLHKFAGSGRRGALAFSPDGKRLAISGWGGVMQVHDISTPFEIRHRIRGDRVCVNPDSQCIFASFGDGRIDVYNLLTGECLGNEQPTDGRRLNLHSLSPDDRWACYQDESSKERSILIADRQTPGRTMTLGPWYADPTFLSDDEIAVPTANGINVHDLQAGRIVKSLPLPATSEPPAHIFLDAEPGRNEVGLALQADNGSWRLFVMDVNDGVSHEISDRSGIIRLSRDGRLAVACAGPQSVRISDVRTGAAICETHTPTGYDDAVDFAPDGRTIASISFDRTLRLWRVSTGQELCALMKFEGPAEGCRFSSDGNTLAAWGKYGDDFDVCAYIIPRVE